MRNFKIQILVLIGLLLATSTLSRVGKIKNIEDGGIRKTDTLALDFNRYFDFSRVADMSKLKFTVTQGSPEGKNAPVAVGTVYQGYDEPFATYDYPTSVFTKAALTKYIDERSFVIISDSGEVIYEETSANGYPRNADEATVKSFKLKFWGPKIACQDVIPWGDNKELLVIGCISRDVKTTAITIWIQIVDRKTFTPQGDATVETFSVDSDFRIFNQIKLLEIYDTTEAGTIVPFLAITDKGKSNKDPVPPVTEQSNPAIILDNTHFIVFDLAQSGKFELNGEYLVSSGGANPFEYIQNYFWQHGELIVVSKLTNVNILQISVCNFKVSMTKNDDITTIDCKGSAAPTAISTGYVSQIEGSSLWATVDLKSPTTIDVQVINTNGQVENPQAWTVLNT